MNKIIKHLQSSSFSLRLRGIFECVAKRNLAPEEQIALIALLQDNCRVDARCVRDFAAAALDHLGICKYAGDNPDVYLLIQDMPYITQDYFEC